MNENAESLYRKGTLLLESDPERALECLTESLRMAPNSPPAIYNRIVALARLGLDAEAVKDLNRLEQLSPALGANLRFTLKASAAPYTDIANQAFENGQLDLALSKYESAITYDPDYANAWVGRGIVLKITGRNDEALRCFNKAIELEPENYFAWINRADFNFRERRLAESLYDYSKAIELLPDDPDAYLGRSSVFLELNQFDKSADDKRLAESLRSKAESLDPDGAR